GTHRDPPGETQGDGGAGRARPGARHPARAEGRGAPEVGQLREAPLVGPRHVDRVAVHRRPRRRGGRRSPSRRRPDRAGPVPGPNRGGPAGGSGARPRRRPARRGVSQVQEGRAGRLPALFISRVRAAIVGYMLLLALVWTVPILVTLIVLVPRPARPGDQRARDALWWTGHLTAGAVLAGVLSDRLDLAHRRRSQAEADAAVERGRLDLERDLRHRLEALYEDRRAFLSSLLHEFRPSVASLSTLARALRRDEEELTAEERT